jgi:uncharacterized protein
MELRQIAPEGRQLIQGYREGGFTISDVRHEGAVLVFPDRTLQWVVGSAETLRESDFAPVRASAAELDMLLLGTGSRQLMLADLRRALQAIGLKLEVMTTPSACRTYNVLLAEDRRVAAALLPI